MCFVLDKKKDYAMAMKLLLSLSDLKKISIFGRWIVMINNISFISVIKYIRSHITWINVIYSASIKIKAIFIYNLLHYNTSHLACVIIYPETNVENSAFLTSTWSQPREKSTFCITFNDFLFIRPVSYTHMDTWLLPLG